MKKINIMLMLIVFSILIIGIASAGITRVPIYNPFGRHLQWISSGFDNELTKDVIWKNDGTTTLLNTSINSSDTLIHLKGNLTLLNYPTSGVLIIDSEAVVYSNYSVGTNLSIDNVTSLNVTRRGAYNTFDTNHSANINTYFTRFLIGTDETSSPWFVINSNGYSGFKNITPGVDLDVEGEIKGNINWTNLQNYPVACTNGAITQLDDSVTCTDGWYELSGEQVLKIQINVSAIVCNRTNVGNIYYNNVTFKHYGCNVSGWQALY